MLGAALQQGGGEVQSAGESTAYQSEDSGEGAPDGGDYADQDEGGKKAEAEGNH
jgi:hypothetical protein